MTTMEQRTMITDQGRPVLQIFCPPDLTEEALIEALECVLSIRRQAVEMKAELAELAEFCGVDTQEQGEGAGEK